MLTEVDVRDRTLHGPYGPLPVRIYQPAETSPTPVGLVWAHGGGFAYGDLDMPESDFVGRELAARGAVVASIGYRLAPAWKSPTRDGDGSPRVHFPVASIEVSAAFAAISASFDQVPPAFWSLGGASAGANLAVSAALRILDAGGSLPRSLVLAYPTMHAELPPLPDELRAKTEHEWSAPDDPAQQLREMNRNYLGQDADGGSRYAFPGGQDLAGLPPTFVLNSDFDVLRASGQAFAAELAAAGVDVLQVRENNTFHGHLNEPHVAAAARSLDRIAAWLSVNPIVGEPHEPSKNRIHQP